MYLLAYLAVSTLIFYVAYVTVGRRLASMFALSSGQDTPAHRMRDGLDYEPARFSFLIPQHFSAIAAAGPIVGPILAGLYFGWGPAWLWILFGTVFVGGIHDFSALVASVRHQGRSIAEIVRQYMNPRAHTLFLLFIWFALIYVVIAFTDITAGTFVQKATTAEGNAPGPAVACSSVLYLSLAVIMGLVLRFLGMNRIHAKMIFLPLVFVAILVGPYLPLDMTRLVPEARAQQVWGYLLLGYCFLAAIAPIWLLLQPRGELGGYFLYIVMIVAVLGIVVGATTGGLHIEQPFFKGWEAKNAFGEPAPLFPILFITVACGACSGFHSVVASGTTSKQLDRECDARPVGYGSMLLEGLFACLSLATLMVLTNIAKPLPDLIYARGIADFGARLLAPFMNVSPHMQDVLLKFALLCFATFVFDTLDACTRLNRYVLMELLGWKTRAQGLIATAISLVLPVAALSLPKATYAGQSLPAWKVFWNIFGSSNQLLAALTLMSVSVWLARKRKAWWVAFFPAVLMMVMTLWSLIVNIEPYLRLIRSGAEIELMRHVQFGIVLSLLVLSAWLIVEAFITWRTMIRTPAPVAEPSHLPDPSQE